MIKRSRRPGKPGRQPAIADFLPTERPSRRALLVELVHVDLELRIKSGAYGRVEDYLAAFGELADDRPTIVDLACFRARLAGTL